MSKQLYIITAHAGEWDASHSWIVGAFQSESIANMIVAQEIERATKQGEAIRIWAESYKQNGLSFESFADFKSAYGPEPEAPYAAYYSITPILLGEWMPPIWEAQKIQATQESLSTEDFNQGYN